MSSLGAIRRWRAQTPERKMQLRPDAIPLNVARSMAFEKETVDIQTIREIHARTEPPALLKQHLASSAPSN